jgi:23S rRNA pseudouridine2605 synthase
MTKRVVVRVAARGYVDGRYIGEEKEVIESIDPSGRGKARRGKPAGKSGAGNANANDNRGNRADQGGRGKRGGKPTPRAAGTESGRRRPPPRGAAQPSAVGAGIGSPTKPQDRNRGRKPRNASQGNLPPRADTAAFGPLPEGGMPTGGVNARTRRNRGGKKTPFRQSRGPNVGHGQTATFPNGPRALISEVAETRRWGDESKSGQFAEALAKEATVKRERLHKVLAQSGHGSRRDMEIMITSGRVMVNGIVATTGTSVSASDAVMIDQRLVKLKFNEDLPRVLLYHKPDGEIVTTNDPGNRITVFDNLPRVENGKWMSIGRLDINTSGLLIFTTNGELANRLMHPRYEVEREYAVRVLGELSEEQTARLLEGVSIVVEADEDDDGSAEDRPAKFDSIEQRGGDGANHWYHVVLREGRNREVRKMFESVGLTVSRLIRVRFGKIGLPPRLTRGRMMELDESQVRAVLRWVGMEVDGPVGALPTNHQPNRGQRPQSKPRQQTDENMSLEGSESAPQAATGEPKRKLGREVRRGRGRLRRERSDAPAVEGHDFVAGDAAVRAFQESNGESEPAVAVIDSVAIPKSTERAPRGARVPRDTRGNGNTQRRQSNRTDRAITVAVGNDIGSGQIEPGNRASNIPMASRNDDAEDDMIGNRIEPNATPGNFNQSGVSKPTGAVEQGQRRKGPPKMLGGMRRGRGRRYPRSSGEGSGNQ